MRKVLVIVGLMLGLNCVGEAQGNYFNYWDSTVEYNYYSGGGYSVSNNIVKEYITKYFDGDTIINSHYYYKQFSLELDSIYSYWGTFLNSQIIIKGPKYVRETQDLKFVEFSIAQNKERTILDDSSIVYKDTLNGMFNGDSWEYTSMCNIGYIDSIVLNQRHLKRECGLWGYYPTKACLIEGIGALSFDVCTPLTVDADYHLVCFKKQNNSINVSQDISCNSFLTPTRYKHFANLILPTKLISFTTNKIGKTIEINWQTTNELNVSHINIQRSVNGKEFTTIGKINASCCNYQFTDDKLPNTTDKLTLYYRLEIVDKDGSKTYSEIRNVELGIRNAGISIYPNPSRDVVSLQVNQFAGNGTIIVTDLFGKQIKTQVLSMGTNTIDVSTFAKGIYFVSVITNDGKRTEKLIVE